MKRIVKSLTGSLPSIHIKKEHDRGTRRLTEDKRPSPVYASILKFRPLRLPPKMHSRWPTKRLR